jgi:predicted nucleic acid-binding protein
VSIVLDASIALAWAFEEEANSEAAVALAHVASDRARVPAIWWFELRNVLIIGERRGRGSASSTAAFLNRLLGFAIEVAPISGEMESLALSRKYRLTFYDATYLELAIRDDLPLATLDRALAAAATAEGVQLVGQP